MNNSNDWYTIANLEEIDSPALLIYPQRVSANISHLLEIAGNVARVRPHMKTNKCAEVARMMIDAGIQQFKCATIAEAEMLGICDAADVLLAYQPSGPKLDRFIKLIKAYPATVFSTVFDNKTTAKQISERASKEDIDIPLYIDLNLGMDRTGLLPGGEAIQLYEYASTLPNIKLMGIHAYDGHIREKDLQVRTAICDKAFSGVEQMRQDLISKDYPAPVIVAGGSPSFPIHAKRKEIQCSPGTFIFWDWSSQQNLPEQSFLPAALVLARVISIPAPGKICVDLGHKSIAAENEITKRVHFLNAPGLVPVSHSEEHLVLETNDPAAFKPGDVLFGLPYHICPTVALYERATIVENSQAQGEWRILARDRRIEL